MAGRSSSCLSTISTLYTLQTAGMPVIQERGNMLIKSVLPNIAVPPIPDNLKANCLLWSDTLRIAPVYYGLNQMCTNGNFANGTTGWGVMSSTNAASNNVLSNTGNGTSASPGTYKSLNISSYNGQKVYVRVTVKVPSGCLTVRGYTNSAPAGTKYAYNLTPSAFGSFVTYSGVAVQTVTDAAILNFYVSHWYADAATANGKVMEIMNVSVFDLTALFGAGNEPTVEEMNAILAADNTPYWEGSHSVLCNPASKYFWHDYSGNSRHMKLSNFGYNASSGWNQVPYIKNSLLQYTPSTWAEWTSKGVGTVVNNFLSYNNNGSTEQASLVFNPKVSTKYGMLFKIQNNTRSISSTIYASNANTPFDTDVNVASGFNGYSKAVLVTRSSFTQTTWRLFIVANIGRVDFGEVRCFELPAGSQIETDFTSLTADELNAKYLFEYVANPSVILRSDGTDDRITRAEPLFIPACSSFCLGLMFSPTVDNNGARLMFGNNTSFDTAIDTDGIGVQFSGAALYINICDIISTGYYGAPGGNIIYNYSGKYYCIICAYNQNDKCLRTYINGQLIFTSPVLPNGNKAINYISQFKAPGAGFSGVKLGFSGWFNKALSNDEVKQLYNANCKRFGLPKI